MVLAEGQRRQNSVVMGKRQMVRAGRVQSSQVISRRLGKAANVETVRKLDGSEPKNYNLSIPFTVHLH